MIRDVLLKQALNLVLVGFAAASAYFGASGVTRTLAEGLHLPTRTPPSACPPPLAEHQNSAAALLERNPFDSQTGPLEATAAGNRFLGDPGRAQREDPLLAPSCDGLAVLIVTESSDRHWSAAALRASDESQARLRRVGDHVAGREVTFIGFNPRESSPAVWLNRGDQLCQVLLRERPALAQMVEHREASDTSVPPAIAAKIRRISEDEFAIERSALEQVLEQQAVLLRQTRIVPELKDGKAFGLRLFGVRPDNLLGLLGLQNGDRLETINGFELASPQKALEAYARLTTASSLVLSVNRHGQTRALRYDVR